MPTYDYLCKACGHEFELFQQMSDSVKRKCPKCGKPKLERLIGIGAGVLFKGGGFYETDYRSDSYTKAVEAEKKAAEVKTDGDKKPAETSLSAAASEGKTKPEGATASKGEASSSSAGEPKRAGGGVAKPPTKSRSSKSASRAARRK